jgi:lysophospholipase L1-like esterase
MADDAAGVRIIGRADWSDSAGPRFCWSGTTIAARFTGASVGVRLRDGGNHFHVTLDGEVLPVLAAVPAQEHYPLASNLSAGPHELVLHRRTEAFVGETQLLGLALEPGGTLLPPPPPAARRLELVGDSITCGYGIEGADQYEPFSPTTENHYLAFGAVTARALGAEAVSIAWSGKGLVRDWRGDTRLAIPELHERVLADRATPWDFGRWIPDAVIINLGTNDFGPGDPGPVFGEAYRAFVARVRARYPRAHILCTLGPLMSEPQVARARAYLAPLLDAGHPRVSHLEFPRQDGSLGYGCDYHPSRATHRAMADRLVPELRRLLGW